MTEDDKLQAIVHRAQSYVGVKESPAGSNNVIFNTLFYGREVHDGDHPGATYPWCGTFVSEIYQIEECPLGNIGYLRGYAGVPYAIDNLAKWGTEVKAEDAKPGYIVMFKFPNHAGVYNWAHTGILKLPITGNTITTIDGNTGIGNDANGGEVMERARPFNPDHIMIIRPNCLNKFNS